MRSNVTSFRGCEIYSVMSSRMLCSMVCVLERFEFYNVFYLILECNEW